MADVIRGLGVVEAQTQLQFIGKDSAKPLLKLLNSAIANAENNHDLEKSNLFIREIRVDQGPVLKRWQPRAHGRATPIRKRSSHISLILAEKVPSQIKKKDKVKAEAPILVKDLKDLPKEEKPDKVEESVKEAAVKETLAAKKEVVEEPFDPRRQGKQRQQQSQTKKGLKKGRIKRLFSRKSV